MKVFIAGARAITTLNTSVLQKLNAISQKGYDVLVGDCYGVDTAVQQFFIERGYKNVTVFASNGKARNNIGNWAVQSVSVDRGLRGFDFYRQKDIAMANIANCGFMIWDGKSKGTLSNIVCLTEQSKKVIVYLSHLDKMILLNSVGGVEELIKLCPPSAQKTLSDLRKKNTKKLEQLPFEQLSIEF